MKKFISRLSAFVAVLFLIPSLTACGFSYDGQTGQIKNELTKLTAPMNLRVENDIIKWSSVSNAGSYIVQIGDESHQAVTAYLEYPISSLLSADAENLYVKVKATPSNSLLFSESDWSDFYGPINYYAKKPDTPVSEKPKLPSPKNVNVVDDVIYWEGVAGAEQYTVCVDEDNTYVTARTQCEINKIINYSGKLQIKIRANETVTNAQSNWSETADYNYIANGTNRSDLAMCNNFSIGRGYNIIEDDYLDTANHASSNAVLDVEKLLTQGQFNPKSAQSQKGEAIMASSLEDFLTETKLDFEYQHESSSALLGKVKHTVNINAAVGYNKYEYINTYSYTYNVTFKNYVIDNFKDGEDGIAACLSSSFKNDIQNKSAQLTKQELVEYIYNNYGTHAILGVVTGGTYRADYTIATNRTELDVNVKAGFQRAVSGDMFGSVIQSTSDLKINLEEHINSKNEHTNASFKSYTYGGSGGGATGPQNVDSGIAVWSKSFDEDNSRSIGFTKNGAIAISTLLKYIDPSLAEAFGNYVDTRAVQVENYLYELLGERKEVTPVESKKFPTVSSTYTVTDTGVYGLAKRNMDTLSLSQFNRYLTDDYLFCFELELNVSEKDQGYQEIYLYNNNTTTNSENVNISEAISEYGMVRGSYMTTPSGQTYSHYINWYIQGSELAETVYLRYDAHGNGDDTWYRNYLNVNLKIVEATDLPDEATVCKNSNQITVTDTGYLGLAARDHDQIDLTDYTRYMRERYVFVFNVGLNMHEKDDGYQEIYLYNSYDKTTSSEYSVEQAKRDFGLVCGTQLEHSPSKQDSTKKDYHFRWVTSGSNIKSPMFIRYDAWGNDNDTWYKNSIEVKLRIFQVPTVNVHIDDMVHDVMD